MGQGIGRAGDARARQHRRLRSSVSGRRTGRLGLVSLLAVVVSFVAAACHAPPDFAAQLEPEDKLFQGDPDVANGVRIYLSSPRHASSGSRGECGWEENINGRLVNLEAAMGTHGAYGLADHWEYDVVVSGNPRDDGYLRNREASNNWGADLHLPVHTNANVGCGNSAQYVLTMFRSTSPASGALASQLAAGLDPVVPGHRNSWNCDGLAECGALAPHVAYLELFFHTNQAAADWFMANGGDHAHGCEGGRCGWAQSGRTVATVVDTYLGHPRPTSTEAIDALDTHPGFGQSPRAMLRDDTIAYWEAYRRELVVAACMNDAGFDHTPDVAFPTEAMQRVAESLAADDPGSSARGRARPAEQNRAYERGLSAGERDRYHRTLHGETAADVDAASRDGVAPDGRGADFATGGCVGEAATAVPSVWGARRALAAEVAAARTGRHGRTDPATDVLGPEHAGRLAAVDARYAGVTERIARDRDFLAYLAQQAALAGDS
jgi:hypothetical protein